jgi:hypothetical protein
MLFDLHLLAGPERLGVGGLARPWFVHSRATTKYPSVFNNMLNLTLDRRQQKKEKKRDGWETHGVWW